MDVVEKTFLSVLKNPFAGSGGIGGGEFVKGFPPRLLGGSPARASGLEIGRELSNDSRQAGQLGVLRKVGDAAIREEIKRIKDLSFLSASSFIAVTAHNRES